MANEKWNLETNSELTAEPGSPVGLVTYPPLTPAQRIAARPADYGEPVLPPKPLWNLDSAGAATSGGFAEPHSVQLFWRSNIGEQAADAATSYKGSTGLQSLYVKGHRVTVVGQGDVILPGGEVNATITGWYDRTDPDHPLWETIQPETAYTFTVAAYNEADEYGPESDPLTVTTPAVGSNRLPVTIPPLTPNTFEFAAPLPVIESAAGGGIQLQWAKVPGATLYEIYDNPNVETDTGMDASRPGLMEGDVKLGEVNQPAGDGPVTFTTPNYTVPGARFALKVRTVLTDANGTAYSPFTEPLRSIIPNAVNSPGKPATPALFEDPIVGGVVKLTIAPGPIGTVNGPPEWYSVYDGANKVAFLTAPLGAAPQVTLNYPASTAYSFTVVAGNSAGVSPASNALAGTTPA